MTGARDQPFLSLLAVRRAEPLSPAAARLVALSDEDLLLRLEAGDCSAAALLFDRYAELVLTIALRILRDQGEAEDVVQEVFLQLVEKVRGFDPAKGTGRNWIIQIAYRRAFDRRGRLDRRHFYDGTDLEHIKNALMGESRLDEQIADVVTGEQLHAAFGELNEKQRATLEMHFFEGLELREISVRLGETLENIRHYYYRGLERLRRSATKRARRDTR